MSLVTVVVASSSSSVVVAAARARTSRGILASSCQELGTAGGDEAADSDEGDEGDGDVDGDVVVLMTGRCWRRQRSSPLPGMVKLT